MNVTNASSSLRKLLGVLPFLLCWSQKAHSQEAAIRVQLTPNVEYDSRQTTFHDGGSLRCHPEWSGGRAEPFEPIRESAEKSESLVLTQTTVKSIRLSQSVYGKGLYDLRTLKIEADIHQGDGIYAAWSMGVKLNDWVFDRIDGNVEFDCGHTTYSAAFSRATLNGEISFTYKIPKGVWVVKASYNSSHHLSLAKPASIEGALRVSQGSRPNEVLIWVRPESTIELKHRFKNFIPGQALSGEAQWKVQPLIESVLPDNIYSSLGNKISIQDSPRAFSSGDASNALKATPFMVLDSPMTDKERLLSILARIVASRPVRESMIKTNRTEAMNQLITQQLVPLAFETKVEDHAPDIKAMAAFAAYALSVDLLRDTAPYCTMTEVETPIAGRTISVRGVKLAWYYLSQAYTRIKYYNFQNYRAIFAEIAAYERAGLTYSDVMRDPNKRTNLLRAYKALTAMDLSKMPFSAALTDVQFILRKFKAVASSEADMNRIIADLSSLAKDERPFVRATMDRFMQFNESNQEKVVISDLIQQLDSIVERQDRVQSNMKDRLRFLSFDESSVTELASFLSQLITRNIEILQKPLSIKDVVTVDFDKLREAFITENNVDSLISTVQQCME